MEIITKFPLGDKIWYVDDSRAVNAEIIGIHVYPERISYSLSREGRSTPSAATEDKCFATKDELMKHVAGE